MKFRDLFTLFVNSDKNYLQKEFGIKKAETFDDFISDLQKKNENEEYISDLKKIAANFFDYFKLKNARNSFKKDNKFKDTNFKK